MSLFGGTTADRSKPKYLTTAEKEKAYATPTGWVYTNDATGVEEILATIPNLNLRLGSPTVSSVDWAAGVVHGSGKTLSAEVFFTQSVDVTAGATLVARANQGPAATLTFAPTTGGTGYSALSGVATTGGTGSGLTVNTTVSGGIIQTVAINAAGTNYTVGDVITITGGGANATFVIATITAVTYTLTYSAGDSTPTKGKLVFKNTNVTVTNLGCVISVGGTSGGSITGTIVDTYEAANTLGVAATKDTLVGGTGYTTGNGKGTLNPVRPGSNGLTVNITAVLGIVTVATIATGGTGYKVGDIVIIDAGNLDATFRVASVTSSGATLSLASTTVATITAT